jgi:chromosome segregation ATPase
MFVDVPEQLILYTAGAFLFGWLLSSISSRFASRYQARKRDPRDVRIRALEAELRIARGDSQKSTSELEQLREELKEVKIGIERRDNVIVDKMKKIEKIKADLKESVRKTRELRSELTERATANMYAEAKIREVETELSVAQASTDLIATGILDYSQPTDQEDARDSARQEVAAEIKKTAT